jgi:hypothetical protein
MALMFLQWYAVSSLNTLIHHKCFLSQTLPMSQIVVSNWYIFVLISAFFSGYTVLNPLWTIKYCCNAKYFYKMNKHSEAFAVWDVMWLQGSSLTLEDGTDSLSQSVGDQLPPYSTQHPRRLKAWIALWQEPENSTDILIVNYHVHMQMRNQDNFSSSVMGRYWDCCTRVDLLLISYLYCSMLLLLGCILNGKLCMSKYKKKAITGSCTYQ